MPFTKTWYNLTSSYSMPALLYHEVEGNVMSGFDYLYKRGYSTADINSCFKNERKKVIITFDDGYADIYTKVFPLFKKYGFTATVFLTTDFVGKEDYLSWSQVQELKSSGFRFESHGTAHRKLGEIELSQAEEEVRASKSVFKEKLGTETEYFAYPHGSYSAVVIKLLKDSGYKGAFTNIFGFNHNALNHFKLCRIEVYPSDTVFDLKLKLSGLQNWLYVKKYL